MAYKPLLCVDFDGVIHSYTSGWQGVDMISDPPVKGAIEWLNHIQEHFDVAIYSSRSKEQPGIDAMILWIKKHGGDTLNLKFPTQKPSAFLTIDDRAIRFDGNFTALTPDHLLAFKPWNKVL